MSRLQAVMEEGVDVTSLVTPINQASVCVCVGGGALNAISDNLVLDKVPNSDQHICSGSKIWNFTVAHTKLKKIRLHITLSMEFVQRNMNQS